MKEHLKVPVVPRNLPMHEMQYIIGAVGETQKEIKAYIDKGRKARGTYKGQGISTNTISRMLGATHKVAFKKSTEKAWEIYAKKTHQLDALEKTADQIKDPKERARFMRFARHQTERQKGRQYDLEVGYEAETDEYYVTSP